MSSLVSIILPVHNAARYLVEAIQSVINQTYPHWELIIINDGSTDDSDVLINQFKDSRIFVFWQTNRGVSSARNVGLAKMRGEYFCFLDADDALPPQSLETRINLFHDGIGFVDGAVALFGSDLKAKRGQWMPQGEGNVQRRLFRLDSSCFLGLTWMIRRQPDVAYHFDESLSHCEDLLFLMSIAGRGHYTSSAETVLCYRRTPGSAMRNIHGLAKGYTMLREKMHSRFARELSWYDKFVYEYKVRRIIFLCYWHADQYFLAVRYLFNGKS